MFTLFSPSAEQLPFKFNSFCHRSANLKPSSLQVHSQYLPVLVVLPHTQFNPHRSSSCVLASLDAALQLSILCWNGCQSLCRGELVLQHIPWQFWSCPQYVSHWRKELDVLRNWKKWTQEEGKIRQISASLPRLRRWRSQGEVPHLSGLHFSNVEAYLVSLQRRQSEVDILEWSSWVKRDAVRLQKEVVPIIADIKNRKSWRANASTSPETAKLPETADIQHLHPVLESCHFWRPIWDPSQHFQPLHWRAGSSFLQSKGAIEASIRFDWRKPCDRYFPLADDSVDNGHNIIKEEGHRPKPILVQGSLSASERATQVEEGRKSKDRGPIPPGADHRGWVEFPHSINQQHVIEGLVFRVLEGLIFQAYKPIFKY